MFRGNAPARIDDKGRLKVPNAFKSLLENKYGRELFLTSLTGEYVRIYPMPVWLELEQKLSEVPSTNPSKLRFLDRVNYYGQAGELDAHHVEALALVEVGRRIDGRERRHRLALVDPHAHAQAAVVAVRDGHHLRERGGDAESPRARRLGDDALAGVRVAVDVAPRATAPVARDLARVAEVVDDGDGHELVVALRVAQVRADRRQPVDGHVERELAAERPGAVAEVRKSHPGAASRGIEALPVVVDLDPFGSPERVDVDRAPWPELDHRAAVALMPEYEVADRVDRDRADPGHRQATDVGAAPVALPGAGRAKHGGDLTGPNPTDRGKPGTKYHVIVATDGIPLGAVPSAANVHDTMMFPTLLRLARTVSAQIRRLYADAGYDSRENRWLCLREGIQPHIRKAGSLHGSGLGTVRTIVEHANAWLLANKRLDRRRDRLAPIIHALLTMACIFVIANRLAEF